MTKALLLRLSLAMLLFASPFVSYSQVIRCGTMYNDSMMRLEDPDRETKEQFESWISEAIEDAKASKIIGGVYQIPVVFHVIHTGTAIGSGSNISQAAIQSQIDVLNEDFRRIVGTNGYNTHPDGADTEIEFCLAQRRPDGSAFTAGQPGVNRILYSTVTATAPPYDQNEMNTLFKAYTYNGGVATATRGWTPDKYMNIWIAPLDGGLLGYAQFPTSPLPGMSDCASGGMVGRDGVVFETTSIGKSSVTGFGAPYNEGRTATHEIGHWLGLRHIWGDALNCTQDDYCNDTPMCDGPNGGCPTGTNSCTVAPDAPDMIENYMDYTYDACMNIFTNDQKQRMRVVLENSPIRASLINSDACTPPSVSDASVTDIFTPKGDHCPGSIVPVVELRNRGGNALTSATISYKIDNGTATTFAWTGTLAAGASVNVSLPAFTLTLGNHTFKSYTTLPNGIADPNPSGDTSSIAFTVSNGIMPDYTENFEGGYFPPDIRWSVTNGGADCFEWVGASATSSTGVLNNGTALMPLYNNTTTQTEILTTPAFILPCGTIAATLTFNVAHRRRTTSGNDRLEVEISEDCGATWASVYNKAGTTLRTVTTELNSEFIPNAAAQWRTETISILPYVDATSDNVRFRFKATGTGGTNANNIYIDNMVFDITTPGEVNVVQTGTTILDDGSYSFGTTASGSTVNATFTVQNTGTSNLVLTPPITVSGPGFSLNTSFGSTTIAAGGSTTFILSFSPTGSGAFTGNVSFATNDCDEGTYNFTLTGNATGVAPVASFTGTPTAVCAGSTVTYTSTSTGSPTSYSWTFPGGTPSSSTAASPAITYNTAGTYSTSLAVTNSSGSNSVTQNNYITVNALPSAPTITAGGPLTFCTGGSVVLTSSAATGNTWSTGATTQSITVTTSGTYTVTRTVGSCTSAASAGTTVTVNPIPSAPTITAGGPLTFCAGGSVVLTSSATTGNTWSTGATTQSITVTTSGTYTVTRAVSGCTSAASAGTTVTVNPIPSAPTISAGGPLTFCAGGSVVLTSSATTGNTWSTGAATQSVTVTTSGTYTVTRAVSGCTSAASAGTTVTVNPAPTAPTISASGPLTFCTGGSVVLTSSATTGNNWSNGATTQSITVTTSGTYTVTRTASGCTSPSSAATTVTVTPVPATPTISAGGPLTFCSGGNVVLTSSSATGNNWSNGAATQSITVTAGGTYTTTVMTGGCSSSPSAGTTVTVNPAPSAPSISAAGPLTFCSGGNVVLTSSAATGNNWSNGATTQSITVSTGGTYTVTQTVSGCVSPASAGTTVAVNPIPSAPTISAGGPLTFCSGGNVVLTSSAASGNDWSNGATTQSITVSAGGTYSVTQTVSGCTSLSSAGTTVTVNPIPASPTISAGGPLTFCSGGNVVLTSSATSGNNWSNGATTQSITVSSGGTYSVTETSSGCGSPSSAGTTVLVNPIPASPAISAGGPLTFCSGGNVVLTSSAASGNTWSNGEMTQSITVSANGVYTVTETSAGCTSPASPSVNVTVNPTPSTPVITANGPVTFCEGSSVTLSSSAVSGNNWSEGSASSSIVVSSNGSFSVEVSENGCVSAPSNTITVIENAIPPTPAITPSGPTTFCEGGSVTLMSSAATGNNWSDGTSSTFVNATSTGTITLSVTENGCSSGSTSISVTENQDPAVTFGQIADLCITSGPVTLNQGSPAGGIYSGNGVSAGVFSPQTAGAGTSLITYTFTDGNGCSGSAVSFVNVSQCLGIEDNKDISVAIFPNPSSGIFKVASSGAELQQITVYDNTGRLVFVTNAEGTSSEVDLSNEAFGLYNVSVKTQTGTSNLRIIIQ